MLYINFSSIGIYNEEFPSINSSDPLITCSHKSNVKHFTCCITTVTSPMATKFCMVATYYEKLQSIRSNNPLNM